MKLKLVSILFFSTFLVVSQTKTVNLKNEFFIKTSSGFLVYGSIDNTVTITKFDNKLNKTSEYTKTLESFNLKMLSVKRFPNYYQVTLFKKLLPIKGIITKLDTNLKLIDEREFSSSDQKYNTDLNSDKFYPSLTIDDERKLTNHYIFYSDKIVIFDRENKKIVFGKQNTTEAIPYYEKIGTVDVLCDGDINRCGFMSENNKVFFYVKTKTDKIGSKSNALGGTMAANIGELIFGEVDIIKNNIKFMSNISNVKPDFDFSFSKLFYDTIINKPVVFGTYLDKLNLEKTNVNEGSEQTGWFSMILDKTGKTELSEFFKNDDKTFKNVKGKFQNNRYTIIKSVKKTTNGYELIAEFSSKTYFNNSSSYVNNMIKIFQPLGFYRFDLNEKLNLQKTDFYPAKVYYKSNFVDVEQSNVFTRPGECRQSSFCLSSIKGQTIIYTYGKNIIKCKNVNEYSFVRELLNSDIEVSTNDMSAITNNEGLVDVLNEYSYKNPNTTWFYPCDDVNYYIVQWKNNEISIDLEPY